MLKNLIITLAAALTAATAAAQAAAQAPADWARPTGPTSDVSKRRTPRWRSIRKSF